MALNADCTEPDELLAVFPCLNCLSISELWMVLLGMFMIANGDPALDDAEQAAQKFRNMSEKEFLQMLIAGLPTSWFEDLTQENLRHDFGCLRCYSPQDIKGMFVNQWCTYWSNIRGEQ